MVAGLQRSNPSPLRLLAVIVMVAAGVAGAADPFLTAGKETMRRTEGASKVHYTLYAPKTYKSGQRLPLVVFFGSTAMAQQNLTQLKPSLDKARWIGVVCGTLASKDEESEFMDTIIRDVPHTRLYLAGTSAGIDRVFTIAATRSETFHGLLAFCSYSTTYLSHESYCSGMMVAFLVSESYVRGDESFATQTEALTKSGCKCRQFAYGGYSSLPPASTINDAIDWVEADVNERETAIMKSLYGKKKYHELYRQAQELKALETPDRPQCKYALEVIPQLERVASREFKAAMSSKNIVTELKAFIDSWGPDCPFTAEATKKFNSLGESLASSLSNQKTPLKTLKSYLENWNDQPFAKPIKDEFNKRGADYYEKLTKTNPNETALLKFVSYWKGCPCVFEAEMKLQVTAKQHAEKLLNSTSTRPLDLISYIKKWEGFEPVKDVQDRYKEMAFQEMEEIKAIENKFPKRLRLQKFIKTFPDSPLVKKAQIMLTEL